jgi:hypothetical protein
MKSSKLADRRPIPRLGLSRAELAIAIGVSTGSVDQMVTEGVLPPPRTWHTRKIWLVSEVEAYLNEWPMEGQNAASISWDEPTPGALVKGRGGYPIANGGPLKEYYDRLGFDPKTMGEADFKRLHAEAEAKWRAEIPTLPLTKLERRSLEQLAEYGPGVVAPRNKIKGCGVNTQERLEARGFIEVKYRDGELDRTEGYILTEKGLSFLQAL